MNLKTADLTSDSQKVIAGILGLVVLGVLYYALPPLVTILKNLWLTVALAVPLLFVAYNYNLLWDMLKKLSWDLTKKWISSDKLWHMWQGHRYLVAKNEALNENIISVGAIESKTRKEITRIITESNTAKKQAVHEEEKGAPPVKVKVLHSKVALLQQQFDTLSPKLAFIENQRVQLVELHANWVADAEILRQHLEAKEQEYELMKELSLASQNASAFLQKDSPEMRNFKESLKQIEQSIDQYTSNVENFQRNVLPLMQTMETQREMNEEEGKKLIDEFKQKRLTLAN